MRTYYDVINGPDLFEYIKSFNPDLASRIDPFGKSVVAFSLVNTTDDSIRTLMMIKLVNQEKPYETIITFPMDLYQKITRKVWADNGTTPN
jgi:hypothetical protein